MFSKQKKHSIVVAALLLFLFGASSPSAALILLSSRPAGIVIDFTGFTDFIPIPSPFSLAYSGGTATFSLPPGESFQKMTQSSGWSGNFAPGDALLWTFSSVGPMDIVFSGGVSAFGTQIQLDALGAATAIIEAFDAGGSSLGSFTVPTFTTNAADNSATFIGVANSPGENAIARINLSASFPIDFAINRVSFTAASSGGGGPAPVPEPSTLALLGMGLLGMFGYGRRRKKSKA